MISDEKQRTQWGCRSCVIVREVWRRGEGWGWEVVGFITYNTKGSQNKKIDYQTRNLINSFLKNKTTGKPSASGVSGHSWVGTRYRNLKA